MNNSTKRILILGSKPNAEIDDFDIAYCANSSGYLYQDKLLNKGEVLNTIVAASELMSIPSRKSKDKDIWQQKRINGIKALRHHNLKIVSSEYFPLSFEDMNGFRDFNYIEMIPHSKYENFVKSVGISYPTITRDHFRPANSILKESVKYALEYMKYQLKNQYLVHPLYRQGTGLICLIEAIMRHGSSASYKVSGIGFDNRNLYQGGDKNTWTPLSKINRNHVLADKKVVTHLAKLYDIEYEKN